MAIGRISSPTTPIPIGTVASPAWASTVQDDINGWLDGTNSMLGLVLDGTGGQAAVPVPGALSVTATAGGLTTPTPAFARAATYMESGLFAAASVSAGTTFVAGLNIQSFVRNSTGLYTLTLKTAGTSISRLLGLGCLPAVTGFIEVIAGSTSTIVVSTFNTSSTLTDMSFNAFVFHV